MEDDQLAWFERHCAAYVERMRACTYESRHHLEGDVWTHTQACYENAVRYGADSAVRWACLLHDVGRLVTRREKDGKVLFGDYEPVSMAMALDILPFAGVPGEQIVRILKIIANHYEVMNHIKFGKPDYESLIQRYRHEEGFLRDLAAYARCDMRARQVHPSREHLYREEPIVDFQQRVSGLPPAPRRPRKLPHTLTLLVGVPGAGKSTFLEQQKTDSRHLVVSRDHYTLQIGALHGHQTYDESFKARLKDQTMDRQVEILDEAYETLAELHPYDVTIDNPNLSRSGRSYWIERKRETHRIRVVVFLKSLSALFDCRREGKTESISKQSIVRRLKKFELPLLSDGIDELVFQLQGPSPTQVAAPPPPPSMD